MPDRILRNEPDVLDPAEQTSGPPRRLAERLIGDPHDLAAVLHEAVRAVESNGVATDATEGQSDIGFTVARYAVVNLPDRSIHVPKAGLEAARGLDGSDRRIVDRIRLRLAAADEGRQHEHENHPDLGHLYLAKGGKTDGNELLIY